MHPVAKTLILLGVSLMVCGILWQIVGRLLPLGHLPGDIVVSGSRTKFFFPVVTCIVVSIVLTLLLNFWRWLNR